MKADVERFKTAHSIEVKCISDRILLYLKWGAYKLGLTEDIFTELYKKIRSNPKYTSQNPRRVAAAILYMGCKDLVTQYIIVNLYEVAPHPLRLTCREIREDFGSSETCHSY